MKFTKGNPQTQTYPFLAQSTHDYKMVVLFVEHSSGIVIEAESEIYAVGDFRTNWKMDTFRPIHGTLEF